MTDIDDLADRVAELSVPDPPVRARRAAVLVLLARRDGDVRLVYTRRRDDLRHHPGQISFPGGALEPDEEIEEAAVREAQEEIGLDPGSVRLVGRLPAFYIPPSRYWLSPVVAVWETPHELRPQPSEVAEILHVSLSRLTDPAALRAVRISSVGWSWAWQLPDDHLLWGATGRVTETLLDVVAPGWTAVGHPSALPAHREVTPWRREVPAVRPASFASARLDDLPQVEADALLSAPPVAEWAAHTATVARALRGSEGRTLVLAGAGGNGALARLVADALRRDGAPVAVLHVGDERAAPPAADLVVDGLVGRGLDGPLRGRAYDLMQALRAFTPRVLAIDVPTGLHPRDGMVGEVITADATMLYGRPAAGLLAPGLSVFRGELVGLVGTRPEPAPARVVEAEGVGWRE